MCDVFGVVGWVLVVVCVVGGDCFGVWVIVVIVVFCVLCLG